jgi:hypothetical protein
MPNDFIEALGRFIGDITDLLALHVHKVTLQNQSIEPESEHVHEKMHPIGMDESARDDREVLFAVHEGVGPENQFLLDPLILKCGDRGGDGGQKQRGRDR